MMSAERKEKVSALVDGELVDDSQSTIDDLLGTPALQASWARYHLISDSLKGNLPEVADSGLASRISAIIRDEPAILAPQVTANNRFYKPLAGLAIAASVAAMAILGIQQNRQAAGDQDQQIISFAAQTPVNAIPVQQVALNPTAEAHLRQVRANTRARLNSYLVNYNEYRTNSGLQGMLPYARTVTFENNR